MSRTPAGTPPNPKGAERFNEERQTYTVRGSDKPDLQKGVEVIRETVKTLPPLPGVYRMQDARGDVLYVGKAKSLKKRVVAYTKPQAQSIRIARMIAETTEMIFISIPTNQRNRF